MKITMNELQAKKVLELLARSDNVLADQDMVDVYGRLKTGLGRAAANPLLTADELTAVDHLVVQALALDPTAGLDLGKVRAALISARPKLQVMAKRQADLEDLRRRTPGMDVDPDVIG